MRMQYLIELEREQKKTHHALGFEEDHTKRVVVSSVVAVGAYKSTSCRVERPRKLQAKTHASKQAKKKKAKICSFVGKAAESLRTGENQTQPKQD